MEWVITGIVLVLIAVLSCVHFGLFSQQLINLIRFFVGDSHYLASIVLGLVGLVMVIYNQPPRFWPKKRKRIRDFLFRFTPLGKFSCFQSNDDPSMICQRLLTSIGEEFSRAQITTKVGGGFIGSMFYQLIFPIFRYRRFRSNIFY